MKAVTLNRYGNANAMLIEQVCVPTKAMAVILDHLNYQQAATIPLSTQAAYQALVKIARMRAGDVVVINGCSGIVGVMAT